MTDAEEDNLQSAVPDPAETDFSDEPQDFRFLASLSQYVSPYILYRTIFNRFLQNNWPPHPSPSRRKRFST